MLNDYDVLNYYVLQFHLFKMDFVLVKSQVNKKKPPILFCLLTYDITYFWYIMSQVIGSVA